MTLVFKHVCYSTILLYHTELDLMTATVLYLCFSMASYAPKKILLTKCPDGSSDSRVSVFHGEFSRDSSPVDDAQSVSRDIYSGDVMVNSEEGLAGRDEGNSQLAALRRGCRSSGSSRLLRTDSGQESHGSLFHDSVFIQGDKAGMLECRDSSYVPLRLYPGQVHFDAVENQSGKEMSNLRASPWYHNSLLMQPSVFGTKKSGGYFRQDDNIEKQSSCMVSETRGKPSNSTVFQKGYSLPPNSSVRLGVAMVSSSCAVSSLTHTSSSSDAKNTRNWLPSRKWCSSDSDNSESKESNSRHCESGMHLKMRVCQSVELVSDECNVIRVSEQISSSHNRYTTPFHARDCTESNSSSQRSSYKPSSFDGVGDGIVDDDEMRSQITEARESSSFMLKDVQPQFLTTSGRNRGRGKANEPKHECQVCGDVAAGFHCGAYVCEACKVC